MLLLGLEWWAPQWVAAGVGWLLVSNIWVFP
jgi:hypothetical protein